MRDDANAFAEELRIVGNNVDLKERESDRRTSDMEINGMIYEYKKLLNSTGTDADSLPRAVQNFIDRARGQSRDVIVDAREQPGMTREIDWRLLFFIAS